MPDNNKKLNLKIRQRNIIDPTSISQSSKLSDTKVYIDVINNSYIPHSVKALVKIMLERGLLQKNDIIEIVKEDIIRDYLEDENTSTFVNEPIAQYISSFKPFPLDDEEEIDNRDIKDLSVITTLGEYLKDNGISQTWLAERTGINRVTIINIIKNPNTVTYINAKKIAMALGVLIEHIFPVI